VGWWEDVYRRKTSVFSAKNRIKKNTGSGAAATFMANTILGVSCGNDERLKALRMIPKS